MTARSSGPLDNIHASSSFTGCHFDVIVFGGKERQDKGGVNIIAMQWNAAQGKKKAKARQGMEGKTR